MHTVLSSNIHCSAALLSAAINLQRTHGLLYAIYFLRNYNFSNCVIRELLGLGLPDKQM